MFKKLIAYDLDGTLADTRRDIVVGVQAMLQAMNKPTMEALAIERHVGEGLNHLVSQCLGEEDPKIIQQGAKHLRKYYQEHLLDFTKLYPMADTTLEYFKDRVQIVVTNKPEPFTSKILQALGVTVYLSEIFTGEQGIPHKPNPGALLKVMNEKKITAEEVLWIGDSVIDAETGKNAGVETVLLRHGFAGRVSLDDLDVEHVVDDFSALLSLAKVKKW